MYDYDKVRRMIERQKEVYNWEFIFLGANIDAAAEAARIGIEASRAARFNSDKAGTALNYSVVSETVSALRMCEPSKMDAVFEERDALGAIRNDFKKRGRR
jgi:hypothetical protein